MQGKCCDKIRSMPLERKKAELRSIYESFDNVAAGYRGNAVCARGCSFCCTQMGNIDIITLEGMIIRDKLEDMTEEIQREIAGRIARNKSDKEEGKRPACPFQNGEGACMIYEVRPFSCRQLYSLRKCDSGGPLVHREAARISRKTVKALQRLDDTGYSGHITFILHLLDSARFRKAYLSGGFSPAAVAEFGKSHGIIINRFAK
jgi:hypothetical protein